MSIPARFWRRRLARFMADRELVTRRRAQHSEGCGRRLSGGSAAQNTERKKRPKSQSSARQPANHCIARQEQLQTPLHISICLLDGVWSCLELPESCDNGTQAKRAARCSSRSRHRARHHRDPKFPARRATRAGRGRRGRPRRGAGARVAEHRRRRDRGPIICRRQARPLRVAQVSVRDGVRGDARRPGVSCEHRRALGARMAGAAGGRGLCEIAARHGRLSPALQTEAGLRRRPRGPEPRGVRHLARAHGPRARAARADGAAGGVPLGPRRRLRRRGHFSGHRRRAREAHSPRAAAGCFREARFDRRTPRARRGDRRPRLRRRQPRHRAGAAVPARQGRGLRGVGHGARGRA